MGASTLRTKPGAPLPYILRSVQGEDGKFVQHAIVTCCACSASASVPWLRAEIPKSICELFERKGWVIYQTKARCPNCGVKRKQQQAVFARMANHEDEMNSSNRPTLVKTDKPEQVSVRKAFLLMIDELGEARIVPMSGATEMLFGDTAYLVIPASAVQ